MNKILTTIFLLVITFSAFSQKYVMVWNDEFNTPGLPDSTKWSHEIGKLRNNELQYYTSRWENARIEDTVLIIEAKKEKYQDADYTSASIISKGVGDWKYGKIEISALVPGGKGTWPALWMMPTYNEYGGWPRSGEIDIMEYVGVEPQNLYFNTHFEGTQGDGHDSYGSGPERVVRNPWLSFIKYELIWTPDKIEWYANDRKVHEYNKPADDYRVWPFDKEFYLIFNLAYGGNWGGYDGVDDSKLPHKFLVDYVRVYQLQESEGPFTLEVQDFKNGEIDISPKLDSYPENTEVTVTAIPDSGYVFQGWKHMSGANPFTFKVVKNTLLSPYFKKENEILSNSGFDFGWGPWKHYVHDYDQINYSLSIEDGMFVNNITKTTGVDWQFGFQESGLSLKKGKYRLTFEAYADMQKTVAITVSKNYADWGAIISKKVTVTTNLKEYELTLDMPRDDDNVRLYFGIGQFLGKFYIDNISLTEIIENPPTGISETSDNSKKFKIFPNPTTGNFSVHVSSFVDSEKYALQIFSLDGKLIYETVIRGSNTEVNPGALKKGIYLVKINSEKSSSTTKLIIN